MQLSRLVDISNDVAATRSRLRKRSLLGEGLRLAGPEEAGLVVHYWTGTLPQGRIGLGPAVLRDLRDTPRAAEASLTLAEVDATFSTIARTTGKGSQERRRALLGGLLERATASEHDFLARLVLGEIRQGALEGVLIEGIAEASGIEPEEIRRAVMLASDPAPVAAAVMRDGRSGLEPFRLEPMSPIRPMLASPADDVAQALDLLGEAALEYKLDGARVQIHRVGSEVRIFSRQLNDVTAALPDIVEIALAQPAQEYIVDGEVLALRDDGRPHPFQVTMRRFGRKSDDEALRRRLPLRVFFFDVLRRDGEDLIDRPLSERVVHLDEGATEDVRIPRIVTDDPAAGAAFLRQAFERGHEGVMAKSLMARYAAGNRGSEWLKLKQAHTLDLVVLAAEWGSGRREGFLSNLHLGARDPDSGGFVMLGKTFKGLTDRMLETQTDALLALEVGREGHVVHVRPEFVVEIAVSDVQSSPQYPAGLALRFARVKRFRRDKSADEVDVVETVRRLHAGQNETPRSD